MIGTVNHFPRTNVAARPHTVEPLCQSHEANQQLALEALRLLNRPNDVPALAEELVRLIKESTGFDAVALRLRQGEDFPYHVQNGFSDDFVRAKNFLCAKGRDATILREAGGKPVSNSRFDDPALFGVHASACLEAADTLKGGHQTPPDRQNENCGKPVLECACGVVLSGRADPTMSCFTTGGSFWTNHSSDLLALAPEADLRANPRNRCIHAGYQSVALIPLQSGDEIIGLLQLNDRRPECFTSDLIHFYEGLAASIGVALKRRRDHEAVQASEEELSRQLEEQKLAAEKIRHQAVLLDQTNDAILVRTLDGPITYWNTGAERLFGWTLREMLGRNPRETLLAATPPGKLDDIERQVLEQGHWLGEMDFVTKTGLQLVGLARKTLVRDSAGVPRSLLFLITDFTEQKKLEAQFLRAQRVESLGMLAGGIAHDLNNILAPIFMVMPVLRDPQTSAEMEESLDLVEASARRASDVVRQLLTFSRGQSGQRLALHLAHLLRDLRRVLRETFPKNITVAITEAPDLWPLVADPTQLHQVLLNLCINARDAMPEGGRLAITAVNFQVDDHFATLVPEARPGRYLQLQVTDTGSGIPLEHLEKIFDPFFTTKEVDCGTGLGLATVRRVVSGHGGFLQVHSQMGQGTTFEVYLPASPAGAL